MKGFDVLKVKSAVKQHNKFDLSRTHLTTMDFGQIVPLMVEETVPGDKFTVSAEYFSRMAPLVKPTYGKFDFRTVCAFVPYHQVAVDSDAWFAGKTVWEGQTPHHRFFYVNDLVDFVINQCATTNGATVNNCDFRMKDSGGTDVYYVFTNFGKYAVKVLNALGYSLPQNVDLRTGSTYVTNVKLYKLSAYPILAFAKLYNDYMSQSQRFNSSPLSSLLQDIKYGRTVSATYISTTGQLTQYALLIIFNNLLLNYDNDYFTSAWQSANNPLSSPDTINAGAVPANGQSASVSTFVNDTTLIQNGGSTLTLGQRALDFLKDFDDWVRRNNYSGSRAVQQIFSRFGIKTDDYKSHYAQVIKTDKMPVQVGDVTATADATNVPLGDYAGKAIMNGQNGFSVSVSDYGLLIVLGYFTVVPMNSFGSDRRVLRNTPLDYYTPEFDGLGADAISVGELYASPIAVDGVDDTSVFGFTERYNAYRYGRDVITGEFRNYRPNADMNTWHTGRNLTAVRNQNALVAQSSSMNTLPLYGSEYNRIFSVTSGDVDHFYLTARFNVDAVRPMLNLNQVTRLGEGDTVVPRNGNTIS